MIKTIIIIFAVVSISVVGGRLYYVLGSTGVSNTGTSVLPETESIGTDPNVSAELATSIPLLISSAYSRNEDNTVIIDGTVLQAGF